MTVVDPEPIVDPARLLRDARRSADLTQLQLAALANVSPSTVCAVEKGRRSPSLELLERLLAAAGRQLRLDTEPLWQGIDAAIDALAGLPVTDRWGQVEVEPTLAGQLSAVPHVVEGMGAAFLQGAPVPVDQWEIAVTEDGLRALHDLLPVPRAFPMPYDPHTWLIPEHGMLRARVVEALPRSVRMALPAGAGTVDVVPLTDFDVHEPRLARVLARVRWRLASMS